LRFQAKILLNEVQGKCFKVATEIKPLQKEFPVLLLNNLENQIFIKQLIDMGEMKLVKGIRNYTTQMLKFLNHFLLVGLKKILHFTLPI
jgi:hypothetical protein